MSRLLERLDVAPLLWVEADDYCAQLLAGGQVPWLDTGGWLAWQRKAQGLLKSDVASLSITAAAAAWLAAHPALQQTMAAKDRLLLPLRALLADEGLRAHLRELAAGLRAVHTNLPLVLVMPSPRHWVAVAYAQAFPDSPAAQVSADDADSAAVYIADFLRAFGDAGIDALLLVEDAGTVPADDDELSCYGAVFNVAAHYRWACGLRLPDGAAFDAGPLDFVIAPHAPSGTRRHGVWIDATNGSAQRFGYVQLPLGLQPERALERLAELRTGS